MKTCPHCGASIRDDDRNAKIWEARKHAANDAEVGEAFGLSAGRVRQILAREGRERREPVPGSKPSYPHANVAEMLELLAAE